MRINTLVFENFQGIRAMRLDLDGHDADIRGDNATGKTTIGNAVSWLLFDKPMTGAKGFTPKTKAADGNDVHHLDHSVAAELMLGDGRIATLRKVFREKWEKRRGSATESFSGHVVDYYIDGVPSKESEFVMWILNNLGDRAHLECLMFPTTFAEGWTWQERRSLLLSICGDINDADVIASTPDLRELPEILRKPGTGNDLYTVEEYAKVAKAKMSDVNKELQLIPSRIDEAARAIPELSEEDHRILSEDISLVTAEKVKRDVELIRLQSDLGKADRMLREDAERALSEARSAYTREQEKRTAAVTAELSALRSRKYEEESLAERHHSAAAAARQEAVKLRMDRESLLKELDEANKELATAAAIEWKQDTICPTCGQEYPSTKVEEMRARFNKMRSERLERARARAEETNARGIAANFSGRTTQAEEKVAASEAAEQQAREEADKLSAKVAELQEKIKGQSTFESTDEYVRLSAKVSEIRSRAENGEGAPARAEKLATMRSEIDGLTKKIEAYTAAKNRRDTGNVQHKRIAELETDEKRLVGEYEALQRGVYLCEEFTRRKVSMLDSRINGRFERVRFRLFQEQINGGLREDCEVLVPGETGLVPYRDANNAARINAGIEIIGVLSRHWGISAPIIVDNAESITRLQAADAQVIRLVVSEQDKKLWLEVNNHGEHADCEDRPI